MGRRKKGTQRRVCASCLVCFLCRLAGLALVLCGSVGDEVCRFAALGLSVPCVAPDCAQWTNTRTHTHDRRFCSCFFFSPSDSKTQWFRRCGRLFLFDFVFACARVLEEHPAAENPFAVCSWPDTARPRALSNSHGFRTGVILAKTRFLLRER